MQRNFTTLEQRSKTLFPVSIFQTKLTFPVPATAFVPALDAQKILCKASTGLQYQSFRTAVQQFMDKLTFSPEMEWLVKLIEDVLVLSFWFAKATTKTETLMAITTFAKCRSDISIAQQLLTGKLMKYVMAAFDTFEFQSGFDTSIDMAEALLFNYTAFKESPLMIKLYKFSTYCVALQLYDKMGITLHHDYYSKVEREMLKRKFGFGSDFVYCLLDTTVFLLKQGKQCMVSGSIDPMFHSGAAYVLWMKEAKEVLALADHVGNPQVCKFDFHTYLSKLDELLTNGKIMLKRSGVTKNTRLEFDLIANLLRSLDAQKLQILTKQSALEMRAQPLGLFVYGDPGVGKTTVMDILFKYYAVLHKANPAESMRDHYKFTKNAFSKYWDNFNSNMWCVVFDDVVAASPNKVLGVDESIKEIICVINNIPYTPDQADLPKKGTTPFKGELVLISSNVNDLAMRIYMAKTYAPLRRIPYRIEPIVREEFRKDGEMRLDSRKAGAVVKTPGAYDDFWRFKICKAMSSAKDPMQGYYVGDQISEEQPLILENMAELLEWYKEISTEHIANQQMMLYASEHSSDVKICECGGKHPLEWCPAPMEEQAYTRIINGITYAFPDREEIPRDVNPAPYVADDDDDLEAYLDIIDVNATLDEREGTFVDRMFTKALHFGLYLYMENYTFRRSSSWLSTLPVVRAYIHRHIMPRLVRPTTQQFIMQTLGDKVNKKLGQCSFSDGLIALLSTSVGVFAIYKSVKAVCGWMKSDTDKEDTPKWEAARDIGKRSNAAREETENFWYKETIEVTPFDMSRSQASMKSWDVERVMEYVGRNCAHIEGTGETEKLESEYMSCKAIALKGKVWLTNYHSIAGFKTLSLNFIIQKQEDGFSTNFQQSFTAASFHRIPDTDLVWFNVTATCPRKDITGLISKPSFVGIMEGMYVQRSEMGVIVRNPCVNVHKGRTILQGGDEITIWMSTPRFETVVGDCGSILVGMSPCGPCILGIHMLGRANTSGAQLLTTDHLRYIDEHAGRVIVQGALKVKAGNIGPNIVAPHVKATPRFVKKGCAQFYGSLDTHNVGGKSRVAKTVLCDTLVATGEYEVLHGAPDLTHWKPWMLAIDQMVDRSVSLDEVILNECVEAYTSHILSNLPEGELEALQILDLGTALNGAPGVKYIDSVNKNTSAGFPFNQSKKFYLTDLEDTSYWQAGVDITPEIENQVDECLEAYARGERFHPIFKGTPKDEALPFRKLDAKKVRIFTGGPFAWGLVVRMYYLSFVRMMTRNRILFEAAVGTNTHSSEWGDLRAYLTQHGTDRMVAGDYAAFDKGMPASVMLAAFEVMRNIHEAALDKHGNRIFSDEDLQVLECIAVDTAYPTIDFHGDIIEFNGTNPSGHPLTVIVNCIANSLYMRYSFAILSREQQSALSTKDFANNVALLTYGDDNAMSVSPEVPFFNHTAIQRVLASVGIKYTMADKEAESVPFIHIDDVSFLKRTWRWEGDINDWAAPLEHASINKMLTMGVVSKTNSPLATAADVIASALGEYFFYGKEIFEAKRALLLDAAHQVGVTPYLTAAKTPTWDTLVARYERASRGVNLYPRDNLPENK
ncbi:hypothetical protein 1 [Hubei leech virus 3]|uniref:hypothetical protein 1 n=1 Tax=Hubei leech virus 3 TaxID=1922901 RepID=UPI00090C9C6F|nr:hypothetical protein 1 [Hubei leech virus 3]APG77498.1 hypothetical protein 1 [Hubei leech virus 3]